MITVLFTTPDHWTFVSWVIKKFTKSEASHAAIGAELYGVPVLLESGMGGVKVTPRDKYFSEGDKLVEEYQFVPDVSTGIKGSVELLGEGYDYVGLIGYGILILAYRWFKKKIKNPLASPKALVCSEFVVRIDDNKMIEEWNDLDPERTTPQDLIEICRTSKNFIRIK